VVSECTAERRRPTSASDVSGILWRPTKGQSTRKCLISAAAVIYLSRCYAVEIALAAAEAGRWAAGRPAAASESQWQHFEKPPRRSAISPIFFAASLLERVSS